MAVIHPDPEVLLPSDTEDDLHDFDDIDIEEERVADDDEREGWYTRHQAVVIGTLSVACLLIVWQAVAAARIWPPLFFPGPLDILGGFASLIAGGDLGRDLLVSGQEMLIGYFLSIVIGLPLGILMGWYRPVRYALDPYVSFFYSTPRIALIPLLIIWVGIGIWSKIIVVFLGAVFPIIVNTMAGVQNLDPGLIRAARSMGATDAKIFRTLALPGSLPFILTGLRLGIGHALTGVVVGELVAAQAGIGLMMAVAGSSFQTAKVFAGVFIIAGAGMVLTFLLQKIEAHFQSWKAAAL